MVRRRFRAAIIVVSVLFITSSCNQVSLNTTATPAPTIESGESEHTVEINDMQRSFLLYIPPGLVRQEPVPVVFAFHGGHRTTALSMKAVSGFNDVADQAGFLVVYPEAVEDHWNLGDVGSGTAENLKIDEGAFVQAILSELGTMVEIDRKRLYAVGYLIGGTLVFQLACQRSDIFAAVASVTGRMEYTSCQPSQPVSVMHIHGSASDGASEVPAVEEGIATWRELDNCTGSPQIEQLSDSIAHTAHSSCEGGTAVELYTIDTFAYSWPSQSIFPATGTIWEFFAAHPKTLTD